MNNKITSMSALMGVAFVASATLTPMALAAEASFTADSLTTGYTLADSSSKSEGEHKCGEAKCGADAKKTDGEGKCGTDKKADGEGKCGAGKKADAEGKCGEGKCGADKKAE